MKARLPQGYGGGPQNMNGMIKQAQKIQEQIELKQEELNGRVFEASAGGGAVTVTVSGARELTAVIVKPEVVDPDDVEMLQDLIIAAANEALRNAKDVSDAELERITGGVGFPGL